jgi:hypothetical protein
MFANRFQSNFPHFGSPKLKLGVLYNNAAHLDICTGRHFTHMSTTHRKEGDVSQQRQPLLISAGFEIWIGTKLNIMFCNGYNAPTPS